jgi:hypothetical protein
MLENLFKLISLYPQGDGNIYLPTYLISTLILSTCYFDALVPWSSSCTRNIFRAKRLWRWHHTIVLHTYSHTSGEG